MTSEKPLVTFYDIESGPPLRTFAPNPWKTRQALNLKRIPYETHWVATPDIPTVRAGLGAPANRTHADGAPFHTLPAIVDTQTGEVVGDSFEIALWLDRRFPEGPRLIHPRTAGLTALLNAEADKLFTDHAALCERQAFQGHAREAEIRETFLKRFHLQSWDQLRLGDDARAELMVSFERALGNLAKAYRHVGGTTDYVFRPDGTAEAQAQNPGREAVGPYLDGDEPAYADLIIGAWLAMFEESLAPEVWGKVSSWHGGLWGRVLDALKPLRKIV